MPEERRVIKIPEVRTTRFRYGRATLTIARSGNFLGGKLRSDIDAFERDELSAPELCAALVRDRIRRYWPSFSFDEADPLRLLALVTESPKTPSSTPPTPS
ncbi:MAG: hypothetical protein BroJett024_43120 [Alphaproteobacteria bacterium]|nr:MAG: hypothetical protein BroJett024_43120 [Alphaproteobacteria bacterium]